MNVIDVLNASWFRWFIEHTNLGDYPYALLCRNDTPSPIWLSRQQQWMALAHEIGDRAFYHRPLP